MRTKTHEEAEDIIQDAKNRIDEIRDAVYISVCERCPYCLLKGDTHCQSCKVQEIDDRLWAISCDINAYNGYEPIEED